MISDLVSVSNSCETFRVFPTFEIAMGFNMGLLPFAIRQKEVAALDDG